MMPIFSDFKYNLNLKIEFCYLMTIAKRSFSLSCKENRSFCEFALKHYNFSSQLYSTSTALQLVAT